MNEDGVLALAYAIGLPIVALVVAVIYECVTRPRARRERQE